MDELGKVFKGKKVLVTGDTGFKGRWLVRSLQYFGADVIGLSIEPPFCRDNKKIDFVLNYQSARIDILDKDRVQKYIKKTNPEFVFHMAAQSIFQNGILHPIETFETNTVGTLNVISSSIATDSVKSLVVATTDKVYENHGESQLFDEGSALGGTDPYAASKTCADIICRSLANFQNSRGLRISTVRAGNVVGGGDWGVGRLVPDICEAALSGATLQVRNLQATRPFQYVLDVIYGYLLVAQSHLNDQSHSKSNFEAFNVGPTDSLAVQEVLEIAKSILNFQYIQVSSELTRLEAKRLMIDSSRLRSNLGWQPRYEPRQAIKESIAWYKVNGFRCEITLSDVREFFE